MPAVPAVSIAQTLLPERFSEAFEGRDTAIMHKHKPFKRGPLSLAKLAAAAPAALEDGGC